MTNFGDLRALLHTEGHRWEEVCELLESYTEELEAAISYCQDMLQLPRRQAPASWVDAMLRGEDVPQLSLCNALSAPSLAHKDEGVRALTQCPHLETLERLEWGRQRVSPEGAHMLAQAPFREHLRSLYLTLNPLEGEGFRAIAKGMPSLERLITDNVQLVDWSWDGTVWSEALRRLGVSGNRLEAQALEALPGMFPNLASLDLIGNPMGLAQSLALANALERLELHELELGWGASMPSDGFTAIVHAPRALRKLEISNEPLDEIEGAQILAQATNLHTLEHLDLSTTYIGDAGLQALLEAQHFAGLKTLHLSCCGLGDEGAHALAAASHLTELTHVTLEENEEIGSSGATALANAEHLPSRTRGYWDRRR